MIFLRLENSLNLKKFLIIGSTVWDSSQNSFPKFDDILSYRATLNMNCDNTLYLAITPLF